MDKIDLKKVIENSSYGEKEALKMEVKSQMEYVTDDEPTKEKLSKLVDDAIEKAYNIGQKCSIPTEELEKIYGNINDLLSKMFSHSEKERADKYRQLYFNQRIITDNLRSALVHAESAVIIYEMNEKGGVPSALSCLGAAPKPKSECMERSL